MGPLRHDVFEPPCGRRDEPSPGPSGSETLLYALRFARECAEQGLTGITIINPKGESYDIGRVGMIVSTREDGPHTDRT